MCWKLITAVGPRYLYFEQTSQFKTHCEFGQCGGGPRIEWRWDTMRLACWENDSGKDRDRKAPVWKLWENSRQGILGMGAGSYTWDRRGRWCQQDMVVDWTWSIKDRKESQMTQGFSV